MSNYIPVWEITFNKKSYKPSADPDEQDIIIGLPDDEAEKLLELGAIKKVPGGKRVDTPSGEDKPLDRMNKAELLAKAQEMGVDANEAMTNREIVSAIEAKAQE